VKLRRDGRAGVDAGMSEVFDLAVLDLGLPELDGFEVARQLRSQHGAGLVIVALSGYSQPEHARRAREVGFDRHLAKPISDAALAAVLRMARGRRDRSGTLEAELPEDILRRGA
jgi:CheY-like chemotaxis protein